jgi:hypothetical protein
MNPPSSTTKPHGPHGPPAILPFILAIVIPLLYGVFAAPLFQSGANPDTNANRLQVVIASFDDGPIGESFLSFFQNFSPSKSWITNNGASPTTMPTFVFESNLTSTIDTLRQSVIDNKYWAAIILHSSISSSYSQAMSSSSLAKAYNPTNALTLIWDDARNNIVSVPRIAGPMKGLLSAFGGASTSKLLAQWISKGSPSSGFNMSNPSDAAALNKMLSAPIQFSEESLYPMTVPSINIAVTVGQILVCVFGIVITNMIWGPLKMHFFIASASPGLAKGLRRYILILAYSCMVGVAFSTILIGIAQTNNTGILSQNFASPAITYGATSAASKFDGNVWAQTWALMWIQSAIFTLWLMIPSTIVGDPSPAGLLLAPMIIYNSISINVDVSDIGFQFFYWAPMWHSSELLRNIMFGTLKSKVAMHVGIHFLWFIVETILFFLASVVEGKKAAAAAAVVASSSSTTAVKTIDGVTSEIPEKIVVELPQGVVVSQSQKEDKDETAS